MKKRAGTFASGVAILVSVFLLLAALVLALIFFSDAFFAYTREDISNAPYPAALLLYALCGGLLIFSAVAHLLARLGYQLRLRSERPAERIDVLSDVDVGIIVPSYR